MAKALAVALMTATGVATGVAASGGARGFRDASIGDAIGDEGVEDSAAGAPVVALGRMDASIGAREEPPLAPRVEMLPSTSGLFGSHPPFAVEPVVRCASGAAEPFSWGLQTEMVRSHGHVLREVAEPGRRLAVVAISGVGDYGIYLHVATAQMGCALVGIDEADVPAWERFLLGLELPLS